jgi:hypothetical protein
MKTCVITLDGEQFPCGLYTTQYDSNGSLAVFLKEPDGAPFTTLSVNMPVGMELLEEGEFYVKAWGGNEGVPEQLVAQGLIEKVKPEKVAHSSYVTAFAYRLLP